MKLFKNGVGRPSNEIKKKRRLFVLSIASIIILFVLITGFILQGINTKKIQGAVITKDKLNKEIVEFDKINAEIVGITNTAPYKSLVNADDETGEYWKKTKTGKYCRGAVQIKANKSNKIYFMTVSYTGAHRYDSTINKGLQNIYFSQDYYKNPTKITAMMPNPVKLGEKNVFKITAKSKNYDDWGTNGIYSSDMRYMTLDNYYEVVFSDNCKKVSLKYIKTEYSATHYEDGKLNGKLECPSTGILNEEITCKIDFGAKDVSWKITGNGKIISKDRESVTFKSSKVGSVKVEVSALGLPKVVKTIKVQNPPVKLSCPVSVPINSSFECSTNQPGVKITVGGAKSLESGYSSSFTTTANDKTKSIKYSTKLFTDYKSIIKKDSKGKEYINAQITATKSGYEKTVKYVRIYKNSSSMLSPLSLTCPTSAKVNEIFKCSTDISGVKITVGGAKSLESGYSSSFTTTSSNKTKNIKYSTKLFTDYKSIIKKDSKGKEYISAKIQASKSGYDTVTKYVNIYKETKTTTNNDAKKANFNVSAVWTNYKVESSIKFNIIQGTFGSKVKYVAYVVCEDELECTASNAWDIMNNKKTGSVTNKIKAKKGDEVVLKLGQFSPQKAQSIANREFYIRRSTYDANKKILYYSVYKIKTASTTRKGAAGDVYNTTLTYITGQFY